MYWDLAASASAASENVVRSFVNKFLNCFGTASQARQKGYSRANTTRSNVEIELVTNSIQLYVSL